MLSWYQLLFHRHAQICERQIFDCYGKIAITDTIAYFIVSNNGLLLLKPCFAVIQ